MNRTSLFLRRFWIRTRDQWIVSFVILLVSILYFRVKSDDLIKPLLLVISVTVIVLTWLVWRYSRREKELLDTLPVLPIGTQNTIRSNHYTREKEKLAGALVNKVLPELLKTLIQELTRLEKVNLLFDAGTGITPVFRLLIRSGLPNIDRQIHVRIFTDNLGAVEELQRLDSSAAYARDINLIGGTLAAEYRATTGEITQKFLYGLWCEQRSADRKIASVAIVSTTWLRIPGDYSQLYLLIRAPEHFDFKTSIIQNADRVIIVSPLGKILRLNDVIELNEILRLRRPEEKGYSEYPIDPTQRVILLTTKRTPGSISPLELISSRLHDPTLKTSNYLVSKDCPVFEVGGKDKNEVLRHEVPLDFAREYFRDLYQLPI